MPVKLKRPTFRHIEAEIFAYRETLQAIDELRQDIIHCSRKDDNSGIVNSEYSGTSTVERRATRLADSLLLREMQRITGAIEEAYLTAKEQGRRIIWVKFGLEIMWEPPVEIAAPMEGVNRGDLSPNDMAEILKVDESTFHRYRTGFVYGVAERLGWW